LKYFLAILFLVQISISFAQVQNDSFFLLKKKGLLKKLGKSIYINNEAETEPVKAVNPFEKFKGKYIRTITIGPTGFYTIVNDTVNGRKNNFGEAIQDAFHKNTLPSVIKKNLFFREGDLLLPLLLADNERFLRDQPFLRDALIVVQQDTAEVNFVDVVVLTRDVFTLGGSINLSSLTRGEAVVQEENLFGTGDRVEVSAFYDKDRSPRMGYGASFGKRNIKNSFINLSAGFKTYSPAFNSGRQEETNLFVNFDKQLVSRYSAWMGNAFLGFSNTKNDYALSPEDYKSNFRYANFTFDTWAGLNIGYKQKRETDSEKRLRHFVAARTLYNTFFKVPEKAVNTYDPSYTNNTGVLFSYTLYKQNFFKTNFIYGFGRKEDVPQGLSATIVSGYTIKQGFKRYYAGVEFEGTKLYKQGLFADYTFKLGSFYNNKKAQDGALLVGVNTFTKLRKLNSVWLQRNFIGLNFARQFNNLFNFPLLIEAPNGLPYFRNLGFGADVRTTLKFETVFFNLKKFVGFRFAPFVFSDFALLKTINETTKQSKGYTALGGGVRARNENLVFGTIELRGFYFPRVNDGVKDWRIEFTTKLRFRYNSSFIRRPDFVSAN
jgi:hypothetical protein